MINLNNSAKKCLDKYLQQVRTYLRGCKTVDADEVERNVIEHIESEFEGATAAVSFEELDAILQKLGSPQQWIPQEELPWWRKIIFKLRSGPEDWRLAYVSFGLLVFGCLLPWTFLVLVLASFIVSRAALAATDYRLDKGQKWLIYPSLVIVYLFIFFWLLVWPIVPLFAIASGYDGAKIDMFPWNTGNETPYWTLAFIFFAGATCLWWLILGLVHKKTPQLLGAVFRPFAEIIKPKSLNWFMVIMAGLVIACLLIIVLMIKYQGWSDYFIKILG